MSFSILHIIGAFCVGFCLGALFGLGLYYIRPRRSNPVKTPDKTTVLSEHQRTKSSTNSGAEPTPINTIPPPPIEEIEKTEQSVIVPPSSLNNNINYPQDDTIDEDDLINREASKFSITLVA